MSSIERVQKDLVKLKRYNELVIKRGAGLKTFNPALPMKELRELNRARDEEYENDSIELALLRSYFGGRRINEVGILLVEQALKLYAVKPRGLLDILRCR